MSTPNKEGAYRLVAINAGVNNPSATRSLLDAVCQACLVKFNHSSLTVSLDIIDLAPLSVDVTRALLAGFPNDPIADASEKLAGADGVLAATPVYKGGMSGLFKGFIDVLDDDLLVAKPVILAAAAGSARHSLVVEDQMRPLFGFMRATSMPTSLFASPDDWGTTELTSRIERASAELTHFVRSNVRQSIIHTDWQNYRHEFGRSPKRGQQPDFDTDLMKAATGGALKVRRN